MPTSAAAFVSDCALAAYTSLLCFHCLNILPHGAADVPANTARLAKIMAGRPRLERVAQAKSEKDKGNDYFRAGETKQAIECYTWAIDGLGNAEDQLASTLRANRAAAYVRLQMWDDALLDCDEALELDAGNLKARMRRAVARSERKEYTGAVADALAVLQQV
jgi:tetratricopeptide (TPR) repeat protein